MQIYHCGCNLNARLSPHYVNRMKSLRVPLSDLSGARGAAPDERSTYILERLPHGAKGGRGCDWILWEEVACLEEQGRRWGKGDDAY